MISNQEKYINLGTQKRDGSFVNTPVWFAQEGEKNNYFIFSNNKAGKIKRIFPWLRYLYVITKEIRLENGIQPKQN